MTHEYHITRSFLTRCYAAEEGPQQSAFYRFSVNGGPEWTDKRSDSAYLPCSFASWARPLGGLDCALRLHTARAADGL